MSLSKVVAKKLANKHIGNDLSKTIKEVERSSEEFHINVVEKRAKDFQEKRFLDISMFPKQALAFEKLQDGVTNEILYGGGARSGKTRLMCNWLLIECISKPGSQWLLGRKELTRLKKTTLIEFFSVLTELGIPKETYNYNDQQSWLKFSNGSTIFLYDLDWMPSDPNYDRIGSLTLTGAAIDEAQEVQYKAINVLRGRFSLLAKYGWKTVPKILMTCNPSRNWIYTEFYKPYKAGTLPKNRVFIPALVVDNPTVPQSYIDFLKQSDEVTVQRLLYGNFEYEDDPNVLFQASKVADMLQKPQKILVTDNRIITADIARFGKDSTVISVWDGFYCSGMIQKRGLDTRQVADLIKNLASQYHIDMDHVICDEDGVGGGVVDALGCRGFVNNSKPLSPYSAKVNSYLKRNFSNLKSQCYWLFSQMVNAGHVNVNVEGTMKEKLSEELGFIRYKEVDTDSKIALESKQDMKDRLGRSPDLADSLMFRFYFELLQHTSLDLVLLGEVPSDNPYKRIIEEFDLEKAFETELEEKKKWENPEICALSALPFEKTI